MDGNLKGSAEHKKPDGKRKGGEGKKKSTGYDSKIEGPQLQPRKRSHEKRRSSSSSRRRSGNNESKPFMKDSSARTPRDEVLYMWRQLVQKQRVHEMIKCLQAGRKKMEVLYNVNKDNFDFMEFSQFAAEHAEAKKDEKRKSDAESEGTSGRKSQGSVKTQKTPSEPSEVEGSSKMKSAHPYNVRTRNAAELLYNKATITDQEFEDILELCEDKIEQKALREAFEEKKARQKYLQGADEARTMLYNFVNSKFFVNFMLVTIITSIVGVFLLTFETISIRYAYPLQITDSVIIGIFLVEAILKITIYKGDYFKLMWNVLDILIVIIHFVEIAVAMVTLTLALSSDLNANIFFKFLKSLRALRLLRVIKFLPNLQVIVTTVFQSMLSIGSIAVLMLLFIFVFAVMGRGLFYEVSPNKFGNMWLSFVTLFQLLTLDDWFETMEIDESLVEEDKFENTDEIDSSIYWLLFIYLFFYLVIEFFVFLNLFVAVLVDNFQLTLADAEIQQQRSVMEEMQSTQKFEAMKKEGIDPYIFEEEHQRQLTEIEQLGMSVEDYFPVDKDSKEAELLADLYKDLNSIDFERFLWRRRYTLFNMVADTALTARQTSLSPDDEVDTAKEDDTIIESREDILRKIRKSLLINPNPSPTSQSEMNIDFDKKRSETKQKTSTK